MLSIGEWPWLWRLFAAAEHWLRHYSGLHNFDQSTHQRTPDPGSRAVCWSGEVSVTPSSVSPGQWQHFWECSNMLCSQGIPETQDHLKWGSQSVSVGCLGTFEAHSSLRCTNEKLSKKKQQKRPWIWKRTRKDKGHTGGLRWRKGKEEIV